MKKNEKREMTFLGHLEAFRGHLIRASASVVVAGITAFFFRNIIFDTILFAPRQKEFITNRLLCELGKYTNSDSLCINSKPFQIINIDLAGQFNTHINLSVIFGILLAFPYVFWEFWRFIQPALKLNEKKHSRGTVFFTSILFTTGSLFGYFVILPLSLDFLSTYSVSDQVLNQINLDSYIDILTSIVLSTGVTFEFPMLIFFLSKMGIVSPDFLKKYRRHAIVVILIIAAIITPPDVFSQTMVALPLYGLYEISILIAKRVRRKDSNLLV